MSDCSVGYGDALFVIIYVRGVTRTPGRGAANPRSAVHKLPCHDTEDIHHWHNVKITTGNSKILVDTELVLSCSLKGPNPCVCLCVPCVRKEHTATKVFITDLTFCKREVSIRWVKIVVYLSGKRIVTNRRQESANLENVG